MEKPEGTIVPSEGTDGQIPQCGEFMEWEGTMDRLRVLRTEDGAGIVACPRCGDAAFTEGADHVAPEYGLPEGSRLLRAYHLSDSTSGPGCLGGYGLDPW